jgi:transposase
MMGLTRVTNPTIKGGALIMKFKQIDGQNQRIERISPTHLVRHRRGKGNSCSSSH